MYTKCTLFICPYLTTLGPKLNRIACYHPRAHIHSPIVCDGCKQHICRQCAVPGSVPNAMSTWNCKLCNSFLQGSHTACDWLLQQLNQRFASRQALDKAEEEQGEKGSVDQRVLIDAASKGAEVQDMGAADRVGGKSIEWNKSGK